MTRGRVVVGILVVALGIGLGAYGLADDGGSAETVPAGTERSVVRPVLGDPDAPLTIVEYSDYLCPYCQQFSSTTEQELISRYVATGQVRIEWHDFPAQGEGAVDAAIAARAAGRQDAYWAYHDLLFARQRSLRYGRDELVALAAELRLDTDRFAADLDDPVLEAAVLGDLAAAQRLGVRATPSFVIGGQAVVGAQALEHFVEVIDSELAAATP